MASRDGPTPVRVRRGESALFGGAGIGGLRGRMWWWHESPCRKGVADREKPDRTFGFGCWAFGRYWIIFWTNDRTSDRQETGSGSNMMHHEFYG